MHTRPGVEQVPLHKKGFKSNTQGSRISRTPLAQSRSRKLMHNHCHGWCRSFT